jgi:hypothetical protein
MVMKEWKCTKNQLTFPKLETRPSQKSENGF